jgi:hypothetical protein
MVDMYIRAYYGCPACSSFFSGHNSGASLKTALRRSWRRLGNGQRALINPSWCDASNNEMKRPSETSGEGLVSRASPVHTALRNCIGDEGGPFEFGDQVADLKAPRAAVVKSHDRERRGNVGTMIPAGMIERGERKRTASEASKADKAMSKPRSDPSYGTSSEDVLIPTERQSGV